ncbi:MAG: serine/threonine-protein kinase [Phycisphaerae bacterium]
MAYTFKHGDRPIDAITIQRAIGRGGFGEVYYALTDSGKQVAVKYLRDNPEIELRGIAHVMNLKSPHLITIYDVRRSDEGDPFVIMEYVSGPSVRELLIAEPNGLGPQKAAFFLSGIAKGLSYLHERGIVHRDLKPGNIFYDDGYVKIGDYGLSKHIAVSAHSGNTISVGTVHYMAPEIGSGSYTKSIDIYALGVMLYEMLSGRLPFTGSSMGEVLMRHLSEQPDVSGIPQPFARVIAKALAKDPKDRYQDVDEMVEAVTSATEVSECLASFDASVLTQTLRAEHAADVDRTRTTAPKAPPVPAVLDARVVEGELPPIPPIPPVLDRKAAKKARKLQKKARKLQYKAEKKAHVMDAKLANLGVAPTARDGLEKTKLLGRSRWRQLVIALVVLFAASGGLGVAYDCPVVFGASLLYLFGGLLGTLLGFGLSVRRDPLKHNFHDRLVYAACGFVFMLPAFAAGYAVDNEGAFARLIIPLTATLVIFNWTERIQLGRRQIIEGGAVFWHGLAGAIFAAMAQAESYAFVAAVLSAVLLILVQLAAGVWPLAVATAAGPAGPQPRKAPKAGAWERVEGVFERASTAIETVGQRLENAFDRGKAKSVEADGDAKKTKETTAEETTAHQTEAAGEQQPPPRPMVIDAYQPSFVGRTANAGLSFLAKLLLLVGLTVALAFSAEFVIPTHAGVFSYESGRLLMVEHNRTQVDQQVPRIAVFAPLLLGSILLIVARRNDGAAHFVRGFFGCVLACVVAVLAIGPAAPEMSLFFEGNWDALESNDRFAQPIVVGAFLVASLLLLFWPKPARRGEKPIVI